MKYYILIPAVIIINIFSLSVFSQSAGRITYNFYSNGKPSGSQPLILEASSTISKYSNSSGEVFYIDYISGKTYQTTSLSDGSLITSPELISNYPEPQLTGDTLTILGYLCRKAGVVIRSNKIDIWFTADSEFKGTPAVNIGAGLGLVLKIVRNGNFEISAENIEPTNDIINLPSSFGKIVELPLYRYLVTKQNYTTVPVFTDEKINFGDTINNPPFGESNITYRFSKGTVILKKIHLPENMGMHTVTAELCERSSGDAYDRTGSCFVIPGDLSKNGELTFIDAFLNGIDKLPEYPANSDKKYRGFALTDSFIPPIELMRFITPFGIGHYNTQVQVYGVKWQDSVKYIQDITPLLPVMNGDIWFGIFIGCYDKGGHTVSLNLKFFPDDIPLEPVPVKPAWIQPLIFTANIMEASSQEYATIFGSDTLNVTVDIPEGLKSLNMRYISTGHGGWESGDEFNKKVNFIFADGKQVYSYIPWRDDCGMYRMFNPASGNFPNGMSSSDFSRSGWCPGSTSIPVDILLTGLRPGRHTFSVHIPMGKPEGTSFSAWNVSAVLIGEY